MVYPHLIMKDQKTWHIHKGIEHVIVSRFQILRPAMFQLPFGYLT